MSKTLSWLLRHAAEKQGLKLSPEGFICVDELLRHPSLNRYTISDIRRVVKNNDKQRFTLRNIGDVLEIRANQGHSIQAIERLELTPILDASSVNNVIHGTYMELWPKIKKEGLSRMRRVHIHFASGLPNDPNVISGIRRDVNVFIYIDLKKALAAGLKFFHSSNRVILSTGDENGVIPPRFFLKVCTANGMLIIYVILVY